MNIRHARKHDAEPIHDLAETSWKDTYEDILGDETITKVIAEWYSIEDLEEQTSHKYFYIAEEHEDLAGFIHAGGDDKTRHSTACI